MSYTVKLVSVLYVLLFISACDNASLDDMKKSFNESYEKGFMQAFEKTFVASCAASGAGEQAQELCNCIANELVTNLDVSSLSDEKKVVSYVQETALPKCQMEG